MWSDGLEACDTADFSLTFHFDDLRFDLTLLHDLMSVVAVNWLRSWKRAEE